jgi:hypothetical protein
MNTTEMMPMRTTLWMITAILLVTAVAAHDDAIANGKLLVDSHVACANLSDTQLESIGEYLMEQAHPGEAHEAMHEMMGIKDGSPEEEQMHRQIAQMMYCGGATGMMNGTLNHPMMARGFAPMMGNGMMRSGYPLMGGFAGYNSTLDALVCIALILLIVWLALSIWKMLQSKK